MDEFDYVCFGRVFKIKDAPDSKLQVSYRHQRKNITRALLGLCILWWFDHATDRRSRSSGKVSDGSERLHLDACLQTGRQSEDACAQTNSRNRIVLSTTETAFDDLSDLYIGFSRSALSCGSTFPCPNQASLTDLLLRAGVSEDGP